MGNERKQERLQIGMLVEMYNPDPDDINRPIHLPLEVKRKLQKLYPDRTTIMLHNTPGQRYRILGTTRSGWFQIESESEGISFIPGKFLKQVDRAN